MSPGSGKCGVADAIRATLATRESRGGEAYLAKSPRFADHRMPIRTGLNRKLKHAKVFIVKSQCLATPLERLGDNESWNTMHHHAATSGPMSCSGSVYIAVPKETAVSPNPEVSEAVPLIGSRNDLRQLSNWQPANETQHIGSV